MSVIGLFFFFSLYCFFFAFLYFLKECQVRNEGMNCEGHIFSRQVWLFPLFCIVYFVIIPYNRLTSTVIFSLLVSVSNHFSVFFFWAL